MYGHKTEIRDKIPLRKGKKHAKILLMLPLSLTTPTPVPQPHLKKKIHLENTLADHVAAGKAAAPSVRGSLGL